MLWCKLPYHTVIQEWVESGYVKVDFEMVIHLLYNRVGHGLKMVKDLAFRDVVWELCFGIVDLSLVVGNAVCLGILLCLLWLIE